MTSTETLPRFLDGCEAFKAEAARLNGEVVRAHNACHDWLIAHPIAAAAPAELRDALSAAEAALEAHREAERIRYYTAMKREA